MKSSPWNLLLFLLAAALPAALAVTNTTATDSLEFTPFFHADEASYRFANFRGPSKYISDYALVAVRCLNALFIEMADLKKDVTSTYPKKTYVCTSVGMAQKATLTLTRTSESDPWLTYQNLAMVMNDLIDAVDDLTNDDRLVDGPFEVWEPPEEPTTKVLDGIWNAAGLGDEGERAASKRRG